jgi:hypothetical protein
MDGLGEFSYGNALIGLYSCTSHLVHCFPCGIYESCGRKMSSRGGAQSAISSPPLIRNRVTSRSTMPEIAEVERARTILDQILVNQTIIDVESVPFPTHISVANPSLMTQ